MGLIWQPKEEHPDVIREKVLSGEKLLIRDPDNLPSNALMLQEGMLINEINLVLAEKRTSLSVMRTGIAILALPLSVLSVLVAISKYYDPMKVLYFLGPLLGFCAILSLLGSYMIYRSVRRIAQLDRVVVKLKKQNASLRELSLVMDDLIKPDHDF